MAFQTKQLYRGLNGAELKTIIPARVAEAMNQDNALNIARGFPLLRYEVTIKLIPYRSAGQDRDGKPVDLPDTAIVYQVEGEQFIPVDTAALELEEISPLYGRDADPQDLRRLAQQGTVESMRTNTGELVDVRTKPGTTELVAAPLVRIPDAPPVPPPPPLTQPEVTAAQQTSAGEDPDKTYEIEEGRWAKAHQDAGIERAVKNAVDDPSAALNSAPGRVSIVTSEGVRRGRGR